MPGLRATRPVWTPSRPAFFTDLTTLRPSRKGEGKQKQSTGVRLAVSPHSRTPPNIRRAPKASWWLDVANPTWDDMRSIGKLLHLHPLTLEDILQQDTREKLELFPKLGYHFIVFRAIESAATRGRFKEQSHAEGDDYQVDDGLIGEANVYLVVFREGVCTVRYSDTSCFGLEHTERVRNRLKLLQDSFHMSSDWIAHGLLDSIVDSFFPTLKEIEKEVAAVEALVVSIRRIHSKSPQTPTATTLRRMARTRRLVTSLCRLLASKSEVISQIQKRCLISSGRFGHDIHTDDVDIAMYMGDVQDHILTLQQALNHYERLLSESHPAYLSQLRLSASRAKKGIDEAMQMLSLVSMGALVPVPILGLFSMNIHIPRNTINPPVPSGSYYWFGIVIVLVLLLECSFLYLVRYWGVQAKRRGNSKLS
ncbi:hypothetical protein BU15DRAFT_48851 [Melanogaster broomeanus]|nr:hypothetical protein BU15DRAFT_48851 [Melanogaster broomeanus]